MKKNIFILLFLLSFSCSTQSELGDKESTFKKVFKVNYQNVWEATIKEASYYKIYNANKLGGFIRTEKNTKLTRPRVFDNLSNLDEIEYFMDIKVSKIKNNLTKVSIKKYPYKIIPFSFGKKKRIKSDFVEERVLMHRIKRNLEIQGLKFE
jgi:hypothetical protein